MTEQKEFILNADLGMIRGIETEEVRIFLGVPFAKAGRFEYASAIDRFDGVLNATAVGSGCPQNRAVHSHLEHPTRRFYWKEYREHSTFTYDENCLNVNIYTPKNAVNCPVVVYFYGGGFDSGLNAEEPFDGTGLAKRGVIAVIANYRVGPFGYFTHEAIFERFGRDGNFGLDDQRTAVKWVKAHIGDFGGDPENITLLGQSAGAISIQYLVLDPDNQGLFQHAAMMSGAGKFPKFGSPKRAEETREYWKEFMGYAGCKTFEEIRNAGPDRIFDAMEKIRSVRKDNIYNTMPVVDGKLLKKPVHELIGTPLPVDYMIGYTNNDMYAPALAFIGNRFGKANGAYVYYFDLDAPGDGNRAFHSADVRYVFETLGRSWRPYGGRDFEAAGQMASYLANFARTGDPNSEGLPEWKPIRRGFGKKVLHIGPDRTEMGNVNYLKLTANFLKIGDPKAES
ncbi:MAG: carboxylesterase/lipase family protein [Lachnospiraceae bacterium]|nr:carboxylesterase/lipase family protein [Lachnospiraceae bacterium]